MTFEVRPVDHESEQYVLGAALLGGERTVDVLVNEVKLAPSHFDRAGLGIIYAAMIELVRGGGGVDVRTVQHALERKLGAQLDGPQLAQLELLSGSVPAVANFRQYAERVIELAGWRARRDEAIAKVEAVTNMDLDAWNAATAAEDAQLAGHDGLLTPELLADGWVDWYDRAGENVIETPWPAINEGLFGGFRPGDTTVLAGWSGMGKTVVGDQLLEYAHRERGLLCCTYINEMSHIDRTSRLLAARSGISFRKIMRRELKPEEARKVLTAATELPFAMQPCAGWSADAICSHLRRHQWGVAFIDLATRIPARKTADWDYISGAFADAARQSNTHVILSVQLNRERATTPERPMPVLRDLRNTGAWEQDARNVLFVHRREELDRETRIPVLHDDGVLQLAKVSNGQQGAAERVYLNYRSMRYDLLATDDPRSTEEF